MGTRRGRRSTAGCRDVLKGDYIGCHPCINTSSLRIRQKDMWEKIVPALEHEPVFVTLEEPQE